MSPFAHAMIDYHEGDDTATFVITRNDGYSQQVPASVFFSDNELPFLEELALNSCRGHILDVGAAAGRHSLKLIKRGFQVTSLDILPEMRKLLRDKGAQRVIISDIFDLSDGCFDTLLMLMNGIGMVGTLDKLDRFLQHAHSITPQSGQIICDSIDVSATSNSVHSLYVQQNIDAGRQAGQQLFTIKYKDIIGEPFDWLHIDFSTLTAHAIKAGWKTELIESDPDGHYLCRLIKLSS